MPALLIRGARQLLTLRGPSNPRRGLEMRELGIVEDGALLIADGIIREAGPARRVENLTEAKSAEVIEAGGRVVMPGFVDGETNLIEAARNDSKSFSNSRLELEARNKLGWFLRHGTTTLAAQAADPAAARVLASLDGRPLDLSLVLSAADANTLPKAPKSVCFASPNEAADVPAFLMAARTLGYSVRAPNGSGASIAVRAGCVTMVQPDKLSDDETNLLAGSSTMALFLPCAAIEQRWPYGPARRLIDEGGAVALGTGFGPRSSSTVSMPMVLALARMRMGLTAAEAIVAATINAAHAVGRGRQIGSLEPGKQADVVIADVNNHRDLAHHLGVNLITTTVKRGRVLTRAAEIEWNRD